MRVSRSPPATGGVVSKHLDKQLKNEVTKLKQDLKTQKEKYAKFVTKHITEVAEYKKEIHDLKEQQNSLQNQLKSIPKSRNSEFHNLKANFSIFTNSYKTDSKNQSNFDNVEGAKSRNALSKANSLAQSSRQSNVCEDCKKKEIEYENELKQILVDHLDTIDQVLCKCCRRMLDVYEFTDHMKHGNYKYTGYKLSSIETRISTLTPTSNKYTVHAKMGANLGQIETGQSKLKSGRMLYTKQNQFSTPENFMKMGKIDLNLKQRTSCVNKNRYNKAKTTTNKCKTTRMCELEDEDIVNRQESFVLEDGSHPTTNYERSIPNKITEISKDNESSESFILASPDISVKNSFKQFGQGYGAITPFELKKMSLSMNRNGKQPQGDEDDGVLFDNEELENVHVPKSCVKNFEMYNDKSIDFALNSKNGRILPQSGQQTPKRGSMRYVN